MKCEVLKLDGKGWQKGKVRLAIEFCLDEPEVEEIAQSNGMVEPESPLDDLRQRVN
ncbi:MAG: KGK domain-containing protein [Coleofasciculaceae cyanobacterium]